VANYYESEFQAIIPCGLPMGATHEEHFQSLEPSSMEWVAVAVPNVRSLYSPFQYLQTSALREDAVIYLQVVYERITVRPFSSLNHPSDAIGAVACYIDGLPVWMLRTW